MSQNPDGKLKSAIGGGMRYDYAYDYMGRLTSKSASGRKLLAYTYDLNGNRSTMTDVTGKCTGYRYNSLDQLLEITDNGKVQARYDYNGDGTIRRMEVGNSLVTEYAYDVDKNLIGQKTMMMGVEGSNSLLGTLQGLGNQAFPASNPLKSAVLVDNTYSYDRNANRIEKRTLAGLNRFAYDSVNRLVKAEYPMGAEEYRYDKAGNRTAKITAGLVEQYHYDGCNRLTRLDITSTDMSRQTKHFTYDNQGNMLSDGNRQFVYDAMNRLSEVKNVDGTHQKNFYDGEGLRAELEENGRLVSFIFDGDRVVNEKDDENTIRYIRGYELISSDSEKARTYYHYACDEMGSITHVTDEAGSILNRYEYDAFGDCTYKDETVANRFGFAGEQYDPVAGMYYLRARFYNPVIGRFIQEDTYYGDGLNLYAYCHNNPVGYVDPSGHAGDCPNKQRALEYLHEQHPDWDDARVRAEYQRVRDRRNIHSALEARYAITGEMMPRHTIEVLPYRILRFKDIILGQAHHLSQNAAFSFGNIISRAEGLCVKLQGNIFKNIGSEHYKAHKFMEEFWNKHRENRTVPTVAEYNKALYDSLISAGFSKDDARFAVLMAYDQQCEHGLTNRSYVPRVPREIHLK